jgi:ABC-2 type transport system ATP-binding protein
MVGGRGRAATEVDSARRGELLEVAVLGVDPARGDERWRARVGIVLQSWRDHARWRVRELLVHLGRYYEPFSTPERSRPYDVDELIDTVGLRGRAEHKISTLSGGERRRLDVAIGIVGGPELLFLDEPTSGFDPQARRDFHDLVHRLSDLEDTTIILTTHDLDEAEKLADRILILAGGRIVADGGASQLARQVAGQAEVRWSFDGEHFVHATPDATRFVRELFAQHEGAVGDLDMSQASLEDTYMECNTTRPATQNGRPSRSRRPTDECLYPFRPIGLGRGLTEFRQSSTNREDVGWYVITGLILLGVLLLQRGGKVEGTTLSLATLSLPGIFGMKLVLGGVIGTGSTLVIHREDGTLLRAKAVPHCMMGYLTGVVLSTSLGTIASIVVLLVPGLFLLDGLTDTGVPGWLTPRVGVRPRFFSPLFPGER